MFDFYKELILELQGIKPQKKLDKTNEYIGDEKDKPILSTRTKLVIWFMGVLYLFVALVGIVAVINSQKYLGLVRYILLIVMDIAAMILSLFKKRKMQMIAIGFVVAFIIVNFSTTIFLSY